MKSGSEKKTLGEVTEPVRTVDPIAKFGSHTFQYLDISSIDRNEKILGNPTIVHGKDAPSRARQLVISGDVLVSTVRPNLNSVAIVPGKVTEAIASTGFTVLRANKDKIIPEYIYYVVQSPKFVDAMTRQATGASYPAVSDRIVKSYLLELPSIEEQQQIVVCMDKANAIRRKRRQAIDLMNDFLRSVFLEMFGESAPGRESWKEVRLEEILKFLTSGSRGWAKYYATSGDLFIRIQNVGNNKLMLDDVAYVQAPDGAEAVRTKVQSGDILLSITADLGRTAVIPNEIETAFINQHLAILRVVDAEPIYVSAFLASEEGQRQIRRLDRVGVKSGLNFDDIKSLKIVLPPKNAQCKFVEIYKRVIAAEKQVVNSETAMSELFKSLTSDLLSEPDHGE